MRIQQRMVRCTGIVNKAKMLPPLGLEGPGEAEELVEFRKTGAMGEGWLGAVA